MTTKRQLIIQLELAGSHYQEAVDRYSWDVAQSYAEVMMNLTRRLHLVQKQEARQLRQSLTESLP